MTVRQTKLKLFIAILTRIEEFYIVFGKVGFSHKNDVIFSHFDAYI
jgi:hypothetical protein